MRKWLGFIIQNYFYGCSICCCISTGVAAVLCLACYNDSLIIGLSIALTILSTISHIINTAFLFLGARMVMKASGVFGSRSNLSRSFETWPDQDTNNYLLFREWNLKKQENFLYTSYGVILLLDSLVFIISNNIMEANMYVILGGVVILLLFGFRMSSKIFYKNKTEMYKWLRKDI